VRLSPQVRAGLDLARGIAAVYVVLHHAIKIEPFGTIFQFGQEAVLIFFLLSGFVIFANEQHRVHRVRGYYLRRIRRIYPPMIVAMLISTILWAVGWIDAEWSWQSLVGTLFALQDVPDLRPGVVAAPYLDNFPLWSLSFEIFFYLIFPAVMIAWRRSETTTRWLIPAITIVAFATFVLWPNHLSIVVTYFLFWWAGAMAACLYMRGHLRFSRAIPELIALIALLAATICAVVIVGFPDRIVMFPVAEARAAAAGLLMFVVLLTPVRKLLAGLSFRVAAPAAAVAGISYGLYVVHYPIMIQTGANLPIWAAVPITVAAAWVADKWVPSLLPRAPRD
jgi:peptidoglycan/LPS O-acetylase OafA/YrhL